MYNRVWEKGMRYYIETDGRIYLIERDGLLDLPKREEIPFSVTEIASLSTSEPVVFCDPQLPRHPREWPGKDEIASAPGVAPLVREAIHAGMPRVVVEGICPKEGKILLVKGSRGLTKGRWSLPGGFLRFGETPQQGLLREIREELGLTGRIESLLDIKGKLGSESRLHWIMVFYRVFLEGDPRPDPDEIAEARYFPVVEASELVLDSLMREVIRSAAPSL
jgi:ADP-ribose pyrophosphatase YjhB (NUDIX family)